MTGVAQMTRGKERKDIPNKMGDKIEHALIEARRIFISDAVDSNSANDIIKKLWYLELTEPGKPILFVINSPGGAVDSGFAIWDQIKMITSPVTTLVTGLAASMGSILSLCASPGRRFATAHSRIMIHQPLGGTAQRQASDIEIEAREILRIKEMLNKSMAEMTGQTFEKIEKDTDRDYFLSAEEAKNYGLIDRVITHPSES